MALSKGYQADRRPGWSDRKCCLWTLPGAPRSLREALERGSVPWPRRCRSRSSRRILGAEARHSASNEKQRVFSWCISERGEVRQRMRGCSEEGKERGEEERGRRGLLGEVSSSLLCGGPISSHTYKRSFPRYLSSLRPISPSSRSRILPFDDPLSLRPARAEPQMSSSSSPLSRALSLVPARAPSQTTLTPL